MAACQHSLTEVLRQIADLTCEQERLAINRFLIVSSHCQCAWIVSLILDCTAPRNTFHRAIQSQDESYDLRKRTETIVHAELRAVLR